MNFVSFIRRDQGSHGIATVGLPNGDDEIMHEAQAESSDDSESDRMDDSVSVIKDHKYLAS